MKMTDHSERAKELLKEGYSCSQAVFATFCEELGLDKDTALKIADAFGGGIGHMGLTCGAITGAAMVAGLRHGRTAAADNEAKQRTSRIVKALAEAFREKHGTIACAALLGCNVGTPEGMQYFKEHGFRNTKCLQYVADAAAILDDILEGK
jgi:C_GCAxxG_C_C family probable redox protein